MLLEFLATELVTNIFFSLSSIDDVLALSSTCHRFRDIYNSSQKLALLETVVDTQFGPLQDLTQLLTHNASQPAHILRSVPFSMALLKQIVHTGRVAEKWADLYPFKKWKYNYENRRLLTMDEKYRIRRAIYRLWLYSRAFHNKSYPREIRVLKAITQIRASLLHNWTTHELAELADMHGVIREVLQNNVCPSNGTIARKFKKRHPDISEHHLLFNNIHLNYPPPPPVTAPPPLPPPVAPAAPGNLHPFPAARFNTLASHFVTSAYTQRFSTSKFSRASHEVGAEGWGDDIPHYYVVEDMLKLDPEQVIWLKENAPLKGMVEGYVGGLGDWFNNNGETFGQTLEWVLDERGEEVSTFLVSIAEGGLGITLR